YHPISATFVYTNTSGAALTIEDVDPGCGCMEPQWDKSTIAAGAQGRIIITYNAELLGRYDRLIAVKTSADETPQMLRMKCKVVEYEVEQPKQEVVEETPEPVVPVQPASDAIDLSKPVLSLSSPYVILGKFKPGKILKGTLVVKNDGNGFLAIDKVQSLSPALVVDFDPVALEHGQKYKLKVFIDTSKMKGPDEVCEFVILSNDQRDPTHKVQVVCQ
ncbi:MAG: DUF1573 domain-containing protein, partial [Bacteroidaceae bacterium]